MRRELLSVVTLTICLGSLVSFGIAQCPGASGNQQRQACTSSGSCPANHNCLNGVCCPSCRQLTNEARQRGPLIGAFVPQCDADGSHSPRQCWGSTGSCWCVTETGEEIPNTRSTPGAPVNVDCAVKRSEWKKNQGNANTNTSPASCAAVLCQVGTVCQVTQVQCVRAPCPPVAMCVPIRNSTSPTLRSCPSGKVWSDCPANCPESCETMNMPCAAACRPGCSCPPRMTRQSRDPNSRCVAISSCRNSNTARCSGGKVWTECGSACPESCDTLGKNRVCTMQCVSGCFCPPGTVLESSQNQSARCVPSSQCPKTQQCPENEEWNDCGTACEETCGNSGSGQACITVCVPGCFCKEGFVRYSSDANVLPLGRTCVIRSGCAIRG